MLSDATKLSALAGLAKLKAASDDFTDEVMGWQWSLYQVGTTATPTESGGVLTIAPTVTNALLGYKSSLTTILPGDFDVQVDFSGVVWTGLLAGRDPRIEMSFGINGLNYCIQKLYANGVTDKRFYGMSNVEGVTQSSEVVTTATSGKFRIVRLGTSLMTFYQSGASWVLLHSRTGFATSGGILYLEAENRSGAYATVSFDNFIVNQGLWHTNDAPIAESQWIACPYKTLGSIAWPENVLGGAGNIKYQYATNNGAYNGSWVTIAAMSAALANVTITDTTNSLRVKAQFNSDGTQLADICIAGYITASDLDYPLPRDVRVGTSYAIGQSIGTLVVGEHCDYPSAGDVRSGTLYANGDFTGTASLHIPAPAPFQSFPDIEDAIIASIKDNVPAIKTVETWAGQIDAELNRLPVRLPAVYVAYGGSAFSGVDGPSHRENAEFTVIVASRNMRGDDAARKDAGGAYEIVQSVLGAIANEDFGYAGIERLVPVRVSLIRASHGMAVYGIGFRTAFDTQYSW